MKKTDPELAVWRQSFQCIIHDHLPILSTLMEMEDTLNGANGYLETVEATDKKQVAMALVVAEIATEYANKLLNHFGLVDGPAPPKPDNLVRALLVVGNLLNFVRKQIKLRQLAAWNENDEEHEPSIVGDEARAVTDGDAATDDNAALADFDKPRVDRDTFTVHWAGKSCKMGNVKEFAIFELLNQRLGRYVHRQTLIEEVWEGDETEKNTVQRTVSSLRDMLKKERMDDLKIDGKQKDHYALMLPEKP